MTVSGSRVTVTDAPTLIKHDLGDGSSVAIKNPTGGNTVDLGEATVTSGGDFTLEAGESVSIDLAPGEQVYGICAATLTQEVQVLANREES